MIYEIILSHMEWSKKRQVVYCFMAGIFSPSIFSATYGGLCQKKLNSVIYRTEMSLQVRLPLRLDLPTPFTRRPSWEVLLLLLLLMVLYGCLVLLCYLNVLLSLAVDCMVLLVG